MDTKKEARWQAGEECYSRSDSTNAPRALGRWLRDSLALRVAVARAYARLLVGKAAALVRGGVRK